jgi:tetratricopeptide (TPR) repeat protein
LALAPGTRLGAYEILSLIGSGGMGEVYRARDSRLNRDVAIKVLPADVAADHDRLARFEREAQVLASLNHPNIGHIYGVDDSCGTPALVMELLDGRTLKDEIARGAVPFGRVIDLAIEVADALDAAHAKGVVHRDIKPANVFITGRGQAKVLDFGIAKIATSVANVARDDDVTHAVRNHATTLGTTLGTAAYMSPEQARGSQIDARSDLFSFGVVLFEMATGVQPFARVTPVATLEAVFAQTPPPPSTLNRSVPVEFDHIVAKAMEKDRDLRYQTAADMRTDLKRLKRTSESAALAAAPTGQTSRNRKRWVLAATGVAVVAVGAAVGYLYGGRPRAFAERDSVVVADFVNHTGEPVFDDTLKEALDVQLRQSPFISVLPEQRVQRTLRLMRRSTGDRLTPDLARELCQRTASKAMIAGSIARLGKSYVISLDATNCRTGDTIDKRQVEAGSQDEVLKALASAADQLRRGLGESLASIAKYDVPLREATTTSLDALKSYSLGQATRRREGMAASIPFYRKAIEQDPDFAGAHASLSTVLANLGETQSAVEEIRKAYELRDRVSEPERLFIIARYYTVVETSVAKTIDTYKVWIQTYPNEFLPHENLGNAYARRNDHAKAVEEFQTAIRLGPDEPLVYGSLASSYLALGKLDEAHKTLYTAIARGMDSAIFRGALYEISSLKKDDADMARQIEAARRFSDSFQALFAQAMVALYGGELARARELAVQYEAGSIATTGLKGSAAVMWARVAEASAEVGDRTAARAEVHRSLALDQSINTLLNGAETFGIIGDTAGARKLLDDARRSLPAVASQEVERIFKRIDAAVRVESGDKRAIEAMPPAQDEDDISSRFTIGRVNLLAGRAEAASTRFKDVMDNHPTQSVTVEPALARLFYGRALVKLGRNDEARKAYEQFFDSWKSADPALPILISARLEYKELLRP